MFSQYYSPQANLDRVNNQINELEKIKNQIQSNMVQTPNINQTFQITPNQNTGINTENLSHLDKLVDIHKDLIEESNMKESDNMRNYGRYNNGEYGRPGYDSYGRRGYDMKYKGYNHLDNMYSNYESYSESRDAYGNGNYNAKQDTINSLEYMMKSAVDFIKMLKEEANSQEEMEIIQRYTRQISQM